MAGSCGLPQCQSELTNQPTSRQPDNQQGDSFRGTCGLPNCRNEVPIATGSRPGTQRQEEAPKAMKNCDIPGCWDEEARAAGKEICLYRQRKTSVLEKFGDAYRSVWNILNKIQNDPYYWSLFKSTVFFVLGLKLFRDMAAAVNLPEIPKCRKPSR